MKRAIVHLELRSSTVGRSCETLLGEQSRNTASGGHVVVDGSQSCDLDTV